MSAKATASCADCAKLREDLERAGIPLFIEARAERLRIAQRARFDEIRGLDAKSATAAIEALDAATRLKLIAALEPEHALRWARGLAGADRRALLERLPVGMHAEIAFALAPAVPRTAVALIKFGEQRSLITRDTRLTPAQAAQCRAVGLAIRGDATKPILGGWSLWTSGGERFVFETAAWALRCELCAGTRHLLATGVLTATPISDDNSRTFALSRWRDAGGERSQLPNLDAIPAEAD